MSVHEHLEHAEHIAHAGGGHDDSHDGGHGAGGALGRRIGVTMAVLGVLIAFSSALVGGARTELVATMIEHANVTAQGQAVSTKYRVLQAELQQIHSMLPDLATIKESRARLEALDAEARSDPVSAALVKALELETGKILDTVTPTHSDVVRFVALAARYARERELARAWAESYEGEIHVHQAAAERFEIASLFAEIGIVMASIALLLQSRGAWNLSILCGAAGVVILGLTSARSHQQIVAAVARVQIAHARYLAAATEASEKKADDELMREITGQEQEMVGSENPGAEPAREPERHE